MDKSHTTMQSTTAVPPHSPQYSLDGIDEDDLGSDYHNALGSTRNDRVEMKRMGKKEELRRNFKPLSTLAFTVILQGTWEVLLAYVIRKLGAGGP